MEKNKNCSVCNIKLDLNKYKKDRTACRDCYNEKKRKNNLVQNEITISHQQPIIENGNIKNNRTLLVGTSFSGKTYLMLKILSRMIDRDIYIITKLDLNKYKKDWTVCRDCYNKKKKNNLVQNEITISHQQPIIENGNNKNNRTLLVGPSFSGKTYLMLKILSRMIDRDIYIITKSPPEQYTNSKIKIKEISDEIKPLNEYENGIIVFDDILGLWNSRFIDQFFIGRRHNSLDIYYLSKSNFDLPKRTIRNNSNKIILFNQTLKDIEHIDRDVASYDMNYDEFKDLGRKSWEEDYNYLYIDRSKKKRSRKILYL